MAVSQGKAVFVGCCGYQQWFCFLLSVVICMDSQCRHHLLAEFFQPYGFPFLHACGSLEIMTSLLIKVRLHS